MGRRGPRPTPTAILKARGSWRAKTRKDEPQPAASIPDPPDWLAPVARAFWDQLVPELAALGLLTRVDGFALARYCQFAAEWLEALKFLQQYGHHLVHKNQEGQVHAIVLHPQNTQLVKLDGTLRKLEAEFGLTPSARARLTIERPAEADPKDGFAPRLAEMG